MLNSTIRQSGSCREPVSRHGLAVWLLVVLCGCLPGKTVCLYEDTLRKDGSLFLCRLSTSCCRKLVLKSRLTSSAAGTAQCELLLPAPNCHRSGYIGRQGPNTFVMICLASFSCEGSERTL